MSTSPGLFAASASQGGLLLPPGFRSAVFGDAAHGDVRCDPTAIEAFAAVGAPQSIAFAHQVHGAVVLEATEPGLVGDCDAIVTTTPDLSITIATADCVPVIIEGGGFAAVVHAGWRGAAAGVVRATMKYLAANGLEPERAAIGPAIGSCCYEVGPEVTAELPDHVSVTDWGTSSVDLVSAVTADLGALEVWRADRCTKTDDAYHSFRRNGTQGRQMAVAWLPSV